MIEIKNLSYVYRSGDKLYQALQDVSLTLSEGKFIAVIGTNGSGKSTLARHLNALFLPTSGKVLVDGFDTGAQENIWLIRQKVGMVFQNPDNQIVAAVVEDDVAFGPENLGLDPEIIRKRVAKALQAVKMEEWRNFSSHLLSGGQKQKVAIAGALALGSKYLVLDEPTAMLDPMSRREVINTLKKLQKEEKITIILITHYMEEVINADEVIVIEKGKVVLKGTPEEVFSQVDKLKDLGLDVPPITELAFLLRNSGLNIPHNIFTVDEMVNYLCPYL